MPPLVLFGVAVVTGGVIFARKTLAAWLGLAAPAVPKPTPVGIVQATQPDGSTVPVQATTLLFPTFVGTPGWSNPPIAMGTVVDAVVALDKIGMLSGDVSSAAHQYPIEGRVTGGDAKTGYLVTIDKVLAIPGINGKPPKSGYNVGNTVKIPDMALSVKRSA